MEDISGSISVNNSHSTWVISESLLFGRTGVITQAGLDLRRSLSPSGHPLPYSSKNMKGPKEEKKKEEKKKEKKRKEEKLTKFCKNVFKIFCRE